MTAGTVTRMLASLCLLLAACTAATGDAQAPVSDGRVRDLAGILDPEVEARLASRLDQAEERFGPQVGIVTVSSLEGRTIEDFTTEYANEWGLGDVNRDDGLIVVVAPNDRKVRIGTGLGIERNYPDAWAQDVIDKTLLPRFREANYGRGLEGAVDMIVERMRQYPTLPANDNAPVSEREAS